MALSADDYGVVGDFTLGTGLAGRLRIASPTPAQVQLLEANIKSASRMIDNYCGRKFAYAAAQADSLPSHGTVSLCLSRPPVWSIASIVDRDGQTIDASEYEVIGDALKYGGVITRENGWLWSTLMRAPGVSWMALPGWERAELVVTYAGGYQTPNQAPVAGVDELPADLVEACYLTATFLHASMGRDPQIRGENLMSYGVQYGAVSTTIGTSGLPLNVEAMLNAHRIVAQV